MGVQTETISPSGQDTRKKSYGKISKILNIFGIYLIAIVFIIVGSFLPGFLSVQNFLNIIDAISLLGIIAVGMSFITFSGHYADMSVPTTMALTGIIAVEMLQYGFFVAMIAALATGVVIGLINAVVVGKFRANPIIWTLAVSYVTMGVIRMVWVNKQIYPDMMAKSETAVQLFDNIYRATFFGGVRLTTVIMILLVIIGQFVLTRTAYGVQLKLTGSALKAAKFTGINVERTIGLAFFICAVTATIGGLCITSLSRVGAWYNGIGYEFKAVTAIVIGGMTLSGGRGSVIGVLGGALVIGLMNNIMTLIGIGTFSQDIIRGIIFIIVVGMNAKSLRSMGRDDS